MCFPGTFYLLVYEPVAFILSVMQCDGTDLEKLKLIADRTNVTDQHLREFMEAYREEFNEELLPGEASIMLTQLVQLYLHISRTLPLNSPPNAPRGAYRA